LIDALISLDCLQQEEIDRFRPVVKLADLGTAVMKGTSPLETPLPIPHYLLQKIRGEKDKNLRRESPSVPPSSDTDHSLAGGEGLSHENDAELTHALKKWRSEVADESCVPLHFILVNSTIEELVKRRPTSPGELLEITGIGPAKLARFGHTLVEIVKEYASPTASRRERAGTSNDNIEPGTEDQEEAAIFAPTPPRRAAPSVVISETPRPARTQQEPSGEVEATSLEDSKPSYYWTWKLISAGFPPEQCAAIRGITRTTVFDDVLQAVKGGYEMRLEWIFSKELLQHLRSMPQDFLEEVPASLMQQLPPQTPRAAVLLYRNLTIGDST
jgi:hypothetical protein